MTLLIGLAPVACGLLVLTLQVDRKQEETIGVTAREAVYAVDRFIDSLHTTASRALSLTGKPCDAILPELRTEAAKQPNVRSLALKKRGTIYCSTLFGSTDIALLPGSYVSDRLRIYPSLRTIPGAHILMYRLRTDVYAALAVAHLQPLQAELLGFQSLVVLGLQFGEQYVWATGNGEYHQVPNHAENTLQLTSEKYGYVVHAGYSDGESWRVIRQAIQTALPSLLLVGIMTSAAGYWGLFRRARLRSTQDQY
ncbi:MAG: CSS-motif domain-containing protein [Pseudomonas sp.]